MSIDPTPEPDRHWPRHCEVCGTELQTAQLSFAEADFSDQHMGTPIVRDFCPNPGCPRHDADLAARGGVVHSDTDDRPGSLGGDNGGA